MTRLSDQPNFEQFLLQPDRYNLRLLVLFRNIVIAAQIVTIAVVISAFRISLPLLPVSLWIGLLVLFNLATWLRLKSPRAVTKSELFGQMLGDIAIFTGLLYFTGGATNPFVGMYLLPLAISAAMLPWAYTASMMIVTCACYLVLLPFHVPLVRVGGELPHFHLFLTGGAINYAITAGLIAYFVFKVTTALRENERLLAKAKENELNSERIIGLGALAAGTAHELGSPLSTVAVVVKELQRDYQHLPELSEGLRIISDQSRICKEALSRLTASANHAQLADGSRLSLEKFLVEIVEKCQLMRPDIKVHHTIEGKRPAPEIFQELALSQSIINLLNNAADASPRHITMESRWNEQELQIRISDKGKGISPEVAGMMGKAFFTTKAAGTGSGLGLLLTNTIISRLGGSVKWFNLPEGGACAEVLLPLSSIVVPS
ncbi:MAG: hypothetical protein A3F74_04840 [Betaproteobacteria bacterium RIFCSPLOWO2_12_FULL_62_58]|nr:MAG: hypothetical protein A3I62_02830 [Betaproteobacteria bacterium RIFCSPLOWO2_02_FULL_62_79]OGA53718.1 MAG: hypothetical protein A3F74_04840 [Betaproteobacteria bacterium RIFCSPLOWO2_12_FULL_62_58]